MIDLHTHILPGLDDGARSLGDALALARDAAAEGVTAIAATPHVRGDYPTTSRQVAAGVAALQERLDRDGVKVRLLPGGEVDLIRLWELPRDELLALTLNGSRKYLLVEFPYRGWPRALRQVLSHLRGLGITAVLAHPERNGDVQDRPERLREAVDGGALVQLTAGSVDGSLGRASQSAAQRLLELGLAHLIATDAHGPHIRMGSLARAATEVGDERLARWLTTDVPAAIAGGRPIPPRRT